MDERETLRVALLLVESFSLQARAGDGGPQPSHPDWPAAKAAMELVVRLGISPHLSSGVGICRPETPLTAAAAIAGHSSDFVHMQPSCLEDGGDSWILLASAELLASFVLPCQGPGTDLSPIAWLVMDCYLSDSMAAYLQLAHGSLPENCVLTDDGKRLVKDRMLQITEMLPVGQVADACFTLLHQSSRPPPAWLKSQVGKLLSKLVMRKGGIAAVLQRLVGGIVKGNMQVYERIAAHLAKIPRTVTKAEEYYKAVCPQLLRLLVFSVSESESECKEYNVESQALQNISVTSLFIACNMIANEQELADAYFVRPLLKPLLGWACGEEETVRQDGPTFKLDLCDLHGRERELVDCLLKIHLLIITGHKNCLFVKEQLFMRLRQVAPLLLKLHYELETWDTEGSLECELHRIYLQPLSSSEVEKCAEPARPMLKEKPASKEDMNKGITEKLRLAVADIVLALTSQPLQLTSSLISTFLWDLNAVILKWPEEPGKTSSALSSGLMQAPSLLRYLSRSILQTENWPLAIDIMREILHKILDLRCNQQSCLSSLAEDVHHLVEGFELINELVGAKALEHDAVQASVLIKAFLDDETVLGDEVMLELILQMVPSVVNGFHQVTCNDDFAASSTCQRKLTAMMDISSSLDRACKSLCISELLKEKATSLYNKSIQ